ncbi:MAG: hypothetical protein H7070_01645 [Saprospiraceae bacterium]|nr:hypothetical protein [Pyrinomonadaceae bacterium]
MKVLKMFSIISICMVSFVLTSLAQGEVKTVKPAFDAALAKKVGADKYGMKTYVLAILKTGPKVFTEAESKELFKGHMANMNRLAAEGKLTVAGPFAKNDKGFRGLFILNVTTVEDAKKLTDTDPVVKSGMMVVEHVVWYGSAALMETNSIHEKITEVEM